jgi:CubicO group peptidase (beta-lactamase class C family)
MVKARKIWVSCIIAFILLTVGCGAPSLTYARIHINEERPYLSLSHQNQTRGGRNFDMGLGWMLNRKNKNILFHAGGTGCFSTYLAIDKERKVASVVLSNYRLFGIYSDERLALSALEYLQNINVSIR